MFKIISHSLDILEAREAEENSKKSTANGQQKTNRNGKLSKIFLEQQKTGICAEQLLPTFKINLLYRNENKNMFVLRSCKTNIYQFYKMFCP